MHDRFNSTTVDRQRTMLRTAMGTTIAKALADPKVIEVMVNPDGKLWIDRHGDGRSDTGEQIGAIQAERIIRLVASHIGQECHADRPVVSAELPENGERFEGLLPPVAITPCFSIRKPAQVLYELIDYVEAQIMSPLQASALSQAVADRKNIVVVGGTSSGKTTLVNALLSEVATSGDRVVIIEDTIHASLIAPQKIALPFGPNLVLLHLAILCARHSDCARIVLLLARYAAPKPSIC